MEFKVLNREEIEQYATNKKHIVISISDPEGRYALIEGRCKLLGILYITFYDLDKVYPRYTQIFNKHIAKDILKFVNQYKDKIELIICQCEAGISRSMGVAGALSKILNGDDSYFFKYGLPNMLVYRTILKEYYGKNFSDRRCSHRRKSNPRTDINFF